MSDIFHHALQVIGSSGRHTQVLVLSMLWQLVLAIWGQVDAQVKVLSSVTFSKMLSHHIQIYMKDLLGMNCGNKNCELIMFFYFYQKVKTPSDENLTIQVN